MLVGVYVSSIAMCFSFPPYFFSEDLSRVTLPCSIHARDHPNTDDSSNVGAQLILFLLPRTPFTGTSLWDSIVIRLDSPNGGPSKIGQRDESSTKRRSLKLTPVPQIEAGPQK